MIEESKVSVIIPIYNTEQYLNKCIESVINQTYKNLEIILVNNNSTDGSLEVCKFFKEKDNRIKIFNEEKKGASGARNTGIEYATGKYIIFLDSDDYFKLNLIKKTIDIFEKYEVQSVIYEIEKKKNNNGNLYKNGFYKCDKILKKIIKNEKINSPVNKVYLTNIIKENSIKFDCKLKIAEDLLFNVKYFKYVKNIYYVNEKLYYYRVNESSITHSYIEDRYEQLMTANNEMLKILKDEQVSIKYIRLKNIYSSIKYWKKYNNNKDFIINKIKEIKKENIKLMLKNNNCFNKLIFLRILFFTI